MFVNKAWADLELTLGEKFDGLGDINAFPGNFQPGSYHCHHSFCSSGRRIFNLRHNCSLHNRSGNWCWLWCNVYWSAFCLGIGRALFFFNLRLRFGCFANCFQLVRICQTFR